MNEIVSSFTEDPTYIYVAGGLAIAIFAAVVFFTGRAVFAWGMAAAAAVMALALLTDFLVVTDRERINDVIAQGAAALKTNQVDEVLKIMSPSATDLRTQARVTMQAVRIKDVRVTSTPQIVINTLKSPKEAIARFMAVGEFQATTLGEVKVPRRVEVRFQWEDDRWLVSGAEWRAIIGEDAGDHGTP